MILLMSDNREGSIVVMDGLVWCGVCGLQASGTCWCSYYKTNSICITGVCTSLDIVH